MTRLVLPLSLLAMLGLLFASCSKKAVITEVRIDSSGSSALGKKLASLLRSVNTNPQCAGETITAMLSEDDTYPSPYYRVDFQFDGTPIYDRDYSLTTVSNSTVFNSDSEFKATVRVIYQEGASSSTSVTTVPPTVTSAQVKMLQWGTASGEAIEIEFSIRVSDGTMLIGAFQGPLEVVTQTQCMQAY